jgi:hypothetical protein
MEFYRGLWVGEAVQLLAGDDVARNGCFGLGDALVRTPKMADG